MPDNFDPAALAIDGPLPSSPGRHRAQRLRRPNRFLRGPISMTWLERAARLSGRALHVALAIRHQSALERSSTVSLPNKQLAKFGVDRDAKRRGLAVLEAARLISVKRKAGRNPTVTIIEREIDQGLQGW